MADLETLLKASLSDEEAGWSMGSFGAIAEFHHVAGDPAPQPGPGLTQITARGGIRIDRLRDLRPVAYETLSPKPHRWSQAIALCLPEAQAAMTRRDALTPLGPDRDALRGTDRAAELFDMGLAQPQVEFCVRTADPALLELLHKQAGRSVFEADNPAMAAILAAHPHRVALTRLGRVEVYQMIGGPDTGGKSPEGPHTHVLAKLLRANRSHSANTPIPDGWLPCASLHSANPVIDRMGRDRPFDARAFEAFQSHLRHWGEESYLDAKLAVWDCLAAGQPPERARAPESRQGRAGWRNGIRQWRVLHGDTALLAAYAERFDRGPEQAEAENPGH